MQSVQYWSKINRVMYDAKIALDRLRYLYRVVRSAPLPLHVLLMAEDELTEESWKVKKCILWKQLIDAAVVDFDIWLKKIMAEKEVRYHNDNNGDLSVARESEDVFKCEKCDKCFASWRACTTHSRFRYGRCMPASMFANSTQFVAFATLITTHEEGLQYIGNIVRLSALVKLFVVGYN